VVSVYLKNNDFLHLFSLIFIIKIMVYFFFQSVLYFDDMNRFCILMISSRELHKRRVFILNLVTTIDIQSILHLYQKDNQTLFHSQNVYE
jgi:hypothetical protein